MARRIALFPAVRHKILVSGTVPAQFVAIDGPLQGSAFEVSDQPFTIGRKADNTLSPTDLSISRQHCTLEMAGGQFRLTDHDSQNGTFVNGVPVRERLLVHGDRIAVGSSLFVFLLEVDPALPVLKAAGSGNAPPMPPALEHLIVGESPAIGHVREFIAHVAPLDSSVLITGETGTGKKLVARSLHDNSPRAEKPFVTINCAALSDTLLEGELFGYERGSFPGAIARQRGALERAEGGTLFVDGIAGFSSPLQNKLLRVIEERKFERLGGTRTLDTDARIIAATTRDLGPDAQSGIFRHDLYFRLRVLSVEAPPLRRRREDIPLLANYFRVQQGAHLKRRVLGITAAAREYLLRYDWPGNVRELKSAIESAVAVGSTDGILPEDLPESVLPVADAEDDVLPRFHRAILETKRELILKAYQQAQGDATRAAALLGLHPNSLQRLVRTLDLQPAIESLSGLEK